MMVDKRKKGVIYLSINKELEMSKKEIYNLKLQNLMDLVPVSTVSKQVNDFIDEEDGTVLERTIRWVVGNYSIYSSMRDVYLIKNNDTEILDFILKRADYKKIALACEARRKELFGKKQKEK